MNFEALLQEQNKQWQQKVAFLSKEEMAFVSVKDTWRHKRIGIFTKEYHSRNELIRHGEIVYGYVFQDWSNDLKGEMDPLTWVLFSPEAKYRKDPTKFQKIAGNLLSFCRKEDVNRKEKRLQKQLKEPLSEAAYVLLPPSLAENDVVYLSIEPRPLSFFSDFRFGINLFFMARTISKEILYLPERYWTPALLEAYRSSFSSCKESLSLSADLS
ncbi:MAG: hypothetical protein PUC66_03035 [Erysipelotrichaceae bacterium]|nr:hypothetical protein [Erysipelotrichaceae bacterium]